VKTTYFLKNRSYNFASKVRVDILTKAMPKFDPRTYRLLYSNLSRYTETPEEEWDDEEEFVDDENVDLIVDGGHYGSISTTPRSAHSDSSKRENSTRGSHEHGKSQRDYSHSQNLTNNSAGMSAAGERMLVSPRVYGADNDDGIAPAPFFLVFCFRHPRTAPTCAWGGGVKTDSFSTTTIRFLFVDAFPGPCLPDPWTCTYLFVHGGNSPTGAQQAEGL